MDQKYHYLSHNLYINNKKDGVLEMIKFKHHGIVKTLYVGETVSPYKDYTYIG